MVDCMMFFFKHKTAYELRISDWRSDVCSSDLFDLPKKKGVLNGLKISIDVQNLFNGYRRVTLDDGTVPAGYGRDEIDPLGRTLRISQIGRASFRERVCQYV